MDHYLLCIYSGISDYEKAIFENYIQSLKPINDCLQSDTTYYAPLLLIGGSTYFNIININSKVELNQEWKEFKNDHAADQIAFENCKETVYESSSVADCINTLADQLPACGSFTLDVVLSSDITDKISVSENLEFAASLHRLAKWHAAHIIFLSDGKVELSKFQQWLELTNGKIYKSNDQLNTGKLVWRGSLEFKHPNISTQSYEHFELRLDFDEQKRSSDLKSLIDNSHCKSDHLILHPVLQAMDVCNFNSIPQHIIMPLAFKLSVSSNYLNTDCMKPFQYLNSRNSAALILRMGYSVLSEKPKPDCSLSTSKWLKMVSLGYVKFPDSSLPEVDNYFTLAVTKTSNSENMLAYVLKEPSCLFTQIYLNVLNLTNNFQKFPTEEMNDDNLNLDIPLISHSSFRTFLQKMEDMDQNYDNECKLTTTNDWDILVQDFLSSISPTSNSALQLDNRNVNVSYEEIDPTDWAERIYLLRKQMQLEEERKCLRSVFMPLSPQKSQYNVSLTAEDLKNYFLPSGEAKDNKKLEHLQLLDEKVNCNKEDFEKLLKMQWPEILNCTYGDIYYNINKQYEEKESIGIEMVRCFVPHETASTCNKQQMFPDAPITVQAKYLTPRKKIKTSVTEKSLIQGMMKSNTKLSKKILNSAELHNNPVISTIMKTFHKSKSMKSANDKQCLLSQKKINPPLRCSPRKKPLVKYYPSTSRSTSEGKYSKNPNELPELLKKKLRVAIASALETNGIFMKDALFRPCFKKLFTICQTFVQDMPRKKGSTSQYMQKIAEDHVKQVIEFEKNKEADV